jgi:ABC-type cobalamin/Fe3+-siderophores transport system ATPase subunit
MTQIYAQLLNPVGTVHLATAEHREMSAGSRQKPVIALLDNSKPNVRFFLDELERELHRRGDYKIVHVRKPRSAEACRDIARIATDCQYVINAVAD